MKPCRVLVASVVSILATLFRFTSKPPGPPEPPGHIAAEAARWQGDARIAPLEAETVRDAGMPATAMAGIRPLVRTAEEEARLATGNSRS